MMLLCTYELGNDIIYRVLIGGCAANWYEKQEKRTFSRITNLGAPQSLGTISTRK